MFLKVFNFSGYAIFNDQPYVYALLVDHSSVASSLFGRPLPLLRLCMIKIFLVFLKVFNFSVYASFNDHYVYVLHGYHSSWA